MLNLAQNLKLRIGLVSEGKDEWLKLELEDDLNLTLVATDYLLTPFATSNRSYHLREGIVIGMRQLVAKAMVDGMIFGYPGASSTWNTEPPKVSSPTTSLTELEL